MKKPKSMPMPKGKAPVMAVGKDSAPMKKAKGMLKGGKK